MKFRVYLEPDEDGVFVATCPALPGCASQGRTRTEATENIHEAIEGYLKSLRKHGDRLRVAAVAYSHRRMSLKPGGERSGAESPF